MRYGLLAGAIALAGAGAYAFRGRKRKPAPTSPRAAIVAHHGNVRKAARALGIAEKTLHAKMNQDPELRELATSLRLKTSRTGFGRPPWKHGRYGS